MKVLLNKGGEITPDVTDDIPVRQMDRLVLEDPDVTEKIHHLSGLYKKEVRRCGASLRKKRDVMRRG